MKRMLLAGLLALAGVWIPSSAQASAWDQPTLTNPTQITITSSNFDLTLGPGDYLIGCGGQTVSIGRLHLNGGHNVVLRNCDLTASPGWAGYLQNQTGELWINNVHFGGSGLTGGVQMQEPGNVTVVFRDVVFDLMHGSQSTNHAECIQTWSGPQRLLVDGLVCPTQYQGLYLLPSQWDTTTQEDQWDIRNTEVDGVGAYGLWLDGVNNQWDTPTFGPPFALNLQSVFDCEPMSPRTYAGANHSNPAWAGVQGCPNPHGEPAWLTGNPAAPVYGLDEPVIPVGGEQ